MLRATFSGFITAQRALAVSQKALDVTGQNMANVNTDGYTRQRLDLYSVSSGSYASQYAFKNNHEIGLGVGVTSVSQVRDQFLDVRFRREFAGLGEIDAKYSALSDLTTIFDNYAFDLLGTRLNDFHDQLSKLQSYTGEPEFEGLVRSSAEMLAIMFRDSAGQVAEIREQQEFQLSDVDIPRVNDILKNISELNKSIRENQVYGNNPLELLDQRNLLLDELSQYVKLDIKYTPVEVARGVYVDDVSIRMKTDSTPPEYTDLVTNLEYATLTSSKDAATGLTSIELTKGGTTTDITDKITNGILKGQLDVLNLSGEFDTPPTDFRGIGFYEKMLDTLASKFAEVFNEANSYPNPAYDPANPGTEPEFLSDRPLFASKDGGPITAANLTIAEGWRAGDYGITATKKVEGVDYIGDGTGYSDNIDLMLSLFNNESFNFETSNGTVIYKGSFEGFFDQIGNMLNLEVNSLKNLSSNYTTVVNGIMDLRDGVSGVSLDEEGIHLLQYSKSYNAAARFMTALDEALDVIINRMGIVGR